MHPDPANQINFVRNFGRNFGRNLVKNLVKNLVMNLVKNLVFLVWAPAEPEFADGWGRWGRC